jgi:hypothetical protein
MAVAFATIDDQSFLPFVFVGYAKVGKYVSVLGDNIEM